MLTNVLILWTCLLIVSLHVTTSQFVDNQLCLSKCLCLPDDKIVSCDRSNNMIGLPTNLDQSYHRLMVQYGNFNDPFLYRRNLSGLSHLTFLKVIYCKLTGVEPRAFEDMKKLKYLDLSHNNIIIIQPFTFIGLDLGEIHLMENHGLQLLSDSFKGMYVESINLRSNDIKSLDFDTFDGIKLQKLFLYNNRISVIDPKFATIFNEPEMLIDLTGNPLDCTCEIKWLLELLRSKLKLPKYFDQMKTVHFLCATPSALTDKELIRVSERELICDKPKIESITISVGEPMTQLTCIVLGTGNRQPGVSWNYMEADNVKELRRNPITKSMKTRERLKASLTINVTVTSDSFKAFTCTTWLEDNFNDKVVVNIKSPRYPLYPIATKSVLAQPANKTNSMKNDILPFLDSHLIYQKQFTILEMIGAIVGTFIITLLLLLMLAQMIRWWKRAEDRELMGNVIKAYWTLEHDSNNTYSHPISHTEYDLPRVYESRHSSICQSPQLNRAGFLDYKTFNNIYSTEASYTFS